LVDHRQSATPRRAVARGFAAAVSCLALIGAWLAGPPPTLAEADDPALVALGVGWYDFNKHTEEAVDFRLEYRHDETVWLFKPWLGIEATSDGAVYGVAGLLVDLDLGSRFVLTPSVGVGAYHDGNGKDLGSGLEFRTQIELAYRFADHSRLGLAVSHISNADFGDSNPGAEVINLYYAVPIGALFSP